MSSPVSLTPKDLQFYRERLAPFLPRQIIDIHAHAWLKSFSVPGNAGPARAVTWTSLMAEDNSIEDLKNTYRSLFPEQETSALIFGFPSEEYDIATVNHYIANNARKNGLYPLLLARPEWSTDYLTEALDEGQFLGAKVYLNFAPHHLGRDDITIFDFAPRHQLEVLNERGAILMLHIPRSGRLGDPQNLADLLEIDATYPRLQTIVAHVGRAYCTGDVGEAFSLLEKSQHLLFDISANTNAEVFARAIEAIGVDRLLFGSDLPITRMRMKRTCEEGRYVNIVPPGLYGDVSADPNLRESSHQEGQNLTFFLYEEVDALLRAAKARQLGTADIEKIFYRNASRLLAQAGQYLDNRGRNL